MSDPVVVVVDNPEPEPEPELIIEPVIIEVEPEPEPIIKPEIDLSVTVAELAGRISNCEARCDEHHGRITTLETPPIIDEPEPVVEPPNPDPPRHDIPPKSRKKGRSLADRYYGR